MNYQTISLQQMEQMLDQRSDFQLIDLRNKPSYEKCHIDGAINIPYRELEYSIGNLQKDILYVLYCSRGGQSMMACNRLINQGYQVMNVASGINNYRGKHLIWS